jgi:hypothetical protein
MNVVTELLADKRKLNEIKELCKAASFQNLLARKIMRDFFSDSVLTPAADSSQNK